MAAHEHEAAQPGLRHQPATAPKTLVMKFGGASVGDPERIRTVAARLVDAKRAGARVVGVLAAMGQTTDDLTGLAHAVSPEPDYRELDVLLSAGERISCALVAMAINDLGLEAVSLTGSQAGIITDATHGKARIVEVRPRRILEALDTDRIVLVAGFQGMSDQAKDITTLGRGGTDTTAVAVAAALSAEACEIFADVAGVLTADPKVVPTASTLPAVSYDEMLELAAAGASVLPLRSVELAWNHGVVLHVRNTFADEPGTWIVSEADPRMEKATITSIASTLDEIVYRAHGTTAAELLTRLAESNVSVDTIIQTGPEAIVFSAPREERAITASCLDEVATNWSEHDELGKITIVGAGIKSHPTIAAQTFQTMRELGIEPHFISTSAIKLAFYIPHGDVERTVQALHERLGLAGG